LAWGAAVPTPMDPKEAYARSHDGSKDKGAAVYERLGCAACHGDRGEGGPGAPALIGLGQLRSKDDLVTSILRPDETIAPGYQRVKVVTSSGKTLTGRLVSEDDERIVLLCGSEKKSIRKSELEQVTRLRSAMPDGLADDATKEELADLVA